MKLWTAVAVWLALAVVHPVAAQFPGDTLRPDSALRDTVNKTARYLEEQQKVAVRLPVLPHLGTSTPQPPGSRLVFTRDSIEWLHGLTLGDILLQVPGVYLWRGGWYGRTESVNYRARGATSVEYDLDGMPYIPVGLDSVGVDPSLISLSFLDRVEVERLPGLLRVHLFSRRHDRLAPRSRIGITSGDASFARYEGELERRASSGFGFALAADYLNSPTIAVRNSRYSNSHVWLQGSYLPSAKFGVQYQVIRSAPNRRPFVAVGALGEEDTLSLGFDASRTDAQLRLSYHPPAAGLGPSIDLLYGRTTWDGTGVTQKVQQVGGLFSLRSPTFALGGSAFYQSRWTPLDARANVAWTPVAPVSSSVEVAYQTHDGNRSSQWALIRAGLEPIHGLAFTGSARLGRELFAPALSTDSTQQVRDYEATAAWQNSWIGLEATYTRTSAFAPFTPAEFFRITAVDPVPSSEWLTVAVRLAPWRWLTLESWYSDPRRATAIEGVPPTHSVTRGTIRSKFLRTFPSGMFDLKLQLSLESWGTGTIGRDATNTPIKLNGATFLGSQVQFEIGRFSFFWDRVNLTASRLGYVPGFTIPPYGSTFGVRWEFLN